MVCPDLRGYGDSGRPPSDPAHRAYSKRAMAEDQREIMARLGFERFAVVGHDRGGRVAYRLALDHPDRVTRLAVLDIVPTLETWARLDRQVGLETYHWILPRAARRPAGAPDRRRPRLFSPLDPRELGRAGPTRSTRGPWPSTGGRSGIPRSSTRPARTTAPAPRSTSRTTPPTGGTAGSRAPFSPSGRRARRGTRWDSARHLAGLGQRRPGPAGPRRPLPSRGGPGRGPGRPPSPSWPGSCAPAPSSRCFTPPPERCLKGQEGGGPT